MKRQNVWASRLVMGVALVFLMIYGVMSFLGHAPEGMSATSKDVVHLSDPSMVHVSELPKEAVATLNLIKAGGPFPYAKDGATFGNFEKILPKQKRGYYTEYTVKTPGASNRGKRRIVAGKGMTGDPATSGEYWYTADHYKSFRRIKEW